jgi:hypothetical protein
MDDVVVLAVSSPRSDLIQHRKWRRLREMPTYGAARSPPSLVQQVWWRDRLDLQHDGVVLMVESFCGRASPTRSRARERERERERLEGSSWPVARVSGKHAPALPSPLNRSRGASKGAALASKSSRWPQGENLPPKFPLPLPIRKP